MQPGSADHDTASAERVLISASRFGDWQLLMKGLIATVVPTIGLGAFVTSARSPRGVAPSALDAVLVAIETTVHLTFWATLAYAYVDWRERAGELLAESKPNLAVIDDHSHKNRASKRIALGEVLLTLWWSGFIVAFVFTQRAIGWRGPDGDVVPVLNPAEWDFWIPLVMLIYANAFTLTIAAYRQGRWTPLTSFVLIGDAVIGAGVSCWLLTSRRALNPAWIAELDWLTAHQRSHMISWGAAVAVTLLGVTTVRTVAMGWRRDRSAPPVRYQP